MRTNLTRATLLIAMLTVAASAWADGAGGADPSTKTLPAKASDTAKANAFGQNAGTKSGGADPASKTLPAKASDTGKANAFGQNAGTGGADPASKTLPAKASD